MLAAPAPAGLYGLSPDVALIQVFNNGSSAAVGAPIPGELQAQQVSTIDETRQVLYMLGFNESDSTSPVNVVGISLATGNVVSTAPMPYASSTFVGVGQNIVCEPKTGVLISSGQEQVNGPHVVGFVKPTTGQYTKVASLPAADLDVLGGPAAYAPETNTYVFQLGVGNGINLFSVNMTDGTYKTFPQSDVSNIETLDYDAKTGLMYGLGIAVSGNAWNRTLVALHPTDMTITTVGVIAGYGIESGGIAALNVAARSLYWIGQQTGAGNNAPFYLIQVSLADASVISASVLCSSDPACPWSLEYLNSA